MVETINNDDENVGSVIAIDWGTEQSRSVLLLFHFEKIVKITFSLYFSVSVCKDGRFEVVENENGKLTLPSYIAFDPKSGNVCLGEAAQGQLMENRENTIYNLTRLIGLTFNEAVQQSDIESLPFRIIEMNSQPRIQVNTEQGERNLTTEQAAAMIFGDLKKKAEAHLNKSVTHAIVVIPGNLNDAQRRAIIDAGSIARLKFIHMMNESTAAAIGKEIGKNNGDKIENTLVFKLGSGSFDVRLMKMRSSIDEMKIKVIASGGDLYLGGNAFNRRIMTEYTKMYNDRKIGDIHSSEIDVQLLNIEVEKTKCHLSDFTSDCIMYPNFFKPLKRSQFEKLNDDLFESTIEIVKKVLNDARMDTNDVDRIILAGGSTKIPKIQKLLSDLFVGKEITFATKEEVSLGAAKQAAVLSGELDPKTLSLSEVSALSLGIEVLKNGIYGIMDVGIPRNTTIPAKVQKNFTTIEDNQESIEIKVYEGEHNKVKNNHLLDEFILTGITIAPRGVPVIKVTMELNVDGILNVTAIDKGNNSQNEISINYNKKRLGKVDIDRMIKENEELLKYEE